MIFKETLQALKNKISLCQRPTVKEFQNLVTEYEKIADWEEQSFEEVEEVIKASAEFAEEINMAPGFPKTVIDIFDLCKSLLAEKKAWATEKDSCMLKCSASKSELKSLRAQVKKLNLEIKRESKSAKKRTPKPKEKLDKLSKPERKPDERQINEL